MTNLLKPPFQKILGTIDGSTKVNLQGESPGKVLYQSNTSHTGTQGIATSNKCMSHNVMYTLFLWWWFVVMLLIFIWTLVPIFIFSYTRQRRVKFISVSKNIKDDIFIYYLKPVKESEEWSLLNFYS